MVTFGLSSKLLKVPTIIVKGSSITNKGTTIYSVGTTIKNEYDKEKKK